MSTLTFKLTDKSNGACDFADLADFSAKLTESLRRVHRTEVAKGKLPRFRIRRLEIGSAVVGLSGDAFSIEGFVETVVSIRNRQRPRLPFTGDDIRVLRSMADPLDSHTKSIEINGQVPIDDQFRSGCDYLLDHVPKSFGQAIGRNDGLNIHAQKYFRIYPEGVNRGAQCYFPAEFMDTVLGSIGKRVRVEGLIHRNPDGTGVDRITDLRALEVIPESADLPPLSSLFGMFANTSLDLCKGWEN